MKSLAIFLLLGATLIGCARSVQVVTLRASNLTPTPDGLVLDTDTLTIRYSFASKRGQMRLSVYNKSNRPLYIDWKRSSFILGKKTFPYWQDVADVQLSTYTPYYRNGSTNFASLNATTQGTLSKELPVSFIPPHTEIRKQTFVVFPKGTVATPGTPTTHQDQVRGSHNPNRLVAIQTYTYPQQQSPLQFRNYLTFATDKDFKNEFTVDSQFWASAIHIEPESQAVDVIQKQPDGSYKNEKSFAQKDGFYIPLANNK